MVLPEEPHAAGFPVSIAGRTCWQTARIRCPAATLRKASSFIKRTKISSFPSMRSMNRILKLLVEDRL